MIFRQIYRVGKGNRLGLCGALFLAYAAAFLWMSDFSDTCIFGGDVWDYQTLAVNVARGRPLALDEPGEPLGALRFAPPNPDHLRFFGFGSVPEMIAHYHRRSGYNTERTPGHYVFIAGIYRISGIHPKVVKEIQLLMLCLVAAFLPALCRSWWGERGWWVGLGSGLIYLASAWRLAGALMSESLCALMAFAVLAGVEWDGREKSWTSAAVLGFVCGIANLVKGCFYFVPWLAVCTLLWRARRARSRKMGWRAVVVCASFLLTVGPWSLYISRASGRPVFLSTMGETLLLDSNNEACLDGGWHPEWRLDPQRSTEFLYSRPELQSASSIGKVVRFYLSHPLAFAFIMAQKVIHGFLGFFSVWVWLSVALLGAVHGFAQRRLVSHSGGGVVSRERLLGLHKGGVIVSVAAAVPLLWYAFPPNGSPELSDSCWLQPDIMEPVVWGLAVLVGVCCRDMFRAIRVLPPSCQIMLANFLAVTLLFYGSLRFLLVIDFMMLALALKQVADVFMEPEFHADVS
ncbi:MAG: hypothetical protein HN742_39825 [Lentisphaerae bacterium]|nr:hypothetical protein [Lentisphaerota bacterium]MBT5611246.1 hypothetical protein [Lentisphaerota bacterium]MBT7057861.1 hypothetical protein [Lentisphaerota bacterium]MBT7848085.1 hypothetical protein [Lentisphaerota bacterium]